MSAQDDQLAMLNTLVRVRIAPSKIHGVGIFAITDIPKGTKLYAEMAPRVFKIPYGSIRKLFPRVRDLLLERWPQIVNGSSFAYPTERIQAFMNHDDDPSYDAVNDITLKDIKEGEEVTEDYTKIPNYEKVFKWLDKKN